MHPVGAQSLVALALVWSNPSLISFFLSCQNAITEREANTYTGPLLSCFIQYSIPHSFFSQHGFPSSSFHCLFFSHLRSDAHINGGLSLLRRSPARRHQIVNTHLTHLSKPLLLLEIALSGNHGQVWSVDHGHLASRCRRKGACGIVVSV